jgi:spermidine synthase
MYHVISTTSISLILYLISYLLYRTGFISLQQHKKLWNTLLAIMFFTTALAGVFLALQITYKWNIPYIKSILKWHVEAGIGLTITGIIHFVWHMKYYVDTSKLGGSAISDNSSNLSISKQKLKLNLFIIGLVSSAVQFLLLRELMNITGGYELISGSFLASWLIGSSIGSHLAGKSKLNKLKRINLVFSLSPFISLMLLLLISRLYLNPGETPSLLVSIIYTFIVLLPFCIISGFTFIKLIYAGRERGITTGDSFSVETSGGIVAGIVTSLLASGLLNTYNSFLIIVILTIAYVIGSYYITLSKWIVYIGILAGVILLAVLVTDPDLYFRRLLQPTVSIVSSTDTPYGNITIGRYKGEESVYYNQKLLSYNDDAPEREEDIHYAMLQKDIVDRVIMISGSLSSHLPEILKYPVKSLTYIERDRELSKYENKTGNTGLVNVVNTDAFNYFRETSDSADVIILLTPPPSTLLLNRYYTFEFFSEVKKMLHNDGVFMCSPGTGNNYYNKESMDLYSSIYNSLAANFRNVKPVGGNKLYFLASDKQISLSFCDLVEKRHIKNVYVNSDYLEDDLILKKSYEIDTLLNRKTKLNRSAFPIASLQAQTYFLSKNPSEKTPSILLLIVAFALPVLAVRRRDIVMYFSASALAGFEMIILITLQITVGNMYQLTGLIIAGFMAGLAAGAGIKNRVLDTILLRNKVIFLTLFYVIFGMLYYYLILPKNAVLSVIEIMVAGFLPAFLTGHIFKNLTAQSVEKKNASSIYSADLSGSALGFILISSIAVPLLGIQVSIYLLAILVFAGLLSIISERD